MLATLIEAGCYVDVRSDEGATVLMTAAQSDDPERLNFLLNRGADPNAVDLRGFTALHRAAEMGHKAAVESLLKGGASPTVEAQGHTPISLAQARGQDEIVTLLNT